MPVESGMVASPARCTRCGFAAHAPRAGTVPLKCFNCGAIGMVTSGPGVAGGGTPSAQLGKFVVSKGPIIGGVEDVMQRTGVLVDVEV
jgi:hypothetical protein